MALDGTMVAAFGVVPSGDGGDVRKMKQAERSEKMKLNLANFTTILALIVGLLAFSARPVFAQTDTNRFRALVLAERGDQHEAYVAAAMEWLKSEAARDHFAMDVFTNPDRFNKEFLARYQVII